MATDSTVILKCYTHQELLLQTAPIAEGIYFFPDWYKCLEKSYQPEFTPFPTMKTCVGVNDLYKRSIVLPLWSDLKLAVNGDGHVLWQFSDGKSQVLMHDQQQRGEFVKDCHHLKLISPWLFECEEDIQFVWLNPFYEHLTLKPYQVMPGVLSFYHQHGTNVQLLVKHTEPFEDTIGFGRPLAFLLPLSDRKVELRRYCISQEEFSRRVGMHTGVTFTNKYRVVCAAKDKFSGLKYEGLTG